MTIQRILNCIHYNSCLPKRPAGVGENRWQGMIKAAMTLYKEGAK